MVRAGLAGLLAAVLAACTMSAAQTPSPSPTIDSVSNAVGQLDGIVADVMTRTGVPGLAVAVVHDGKVLLTKGYGIREVGTNAPVGADTVFPDRLRLQADQCFSGGCSHRQGLRDLGRSGGHPPVVVRTQR